MVLCLNNKIGDGGESSRILGKGNKKNAEEDSQVMQIILNINEGKSRGHIDTPYPSEENMYQDRSRSTRLIYRKEKFHLRQMNKKDISIIKENYPIPHQIMKKI